MTTNFTKNFSCGEMPDIDEIKVITYNRIMSFSIMAFPEMEILGFWCGNFRYWRPRLCGKHNKYFHFVQKVKISVNNLIAVTGFSFFRSMHNIFNHLLASLCVADLLFILFNLLLVPIALGLDNAFTKFIFTSAECG